MKNGCLAATPLRLINYAVGSTIISLSESRTVSVGQKKNLRLICIMKFLKEAHDLYLRGFKGKYIKDQTGYTIKQLKNDLAKIGIILKKEQIIPYQIEYIQKRYTTLDVEAAYIRWSKSFENLENACHARQIEDLGCCFGKIKDMLVSILGDVRYKELRNELWANKMQKTMVDRYGVENPFYDQDQFISDEVRKNAYVKHKQTMMKKYGVENATQNEVIRKRMLKSLKKTNLEKYGVEFPMQDYNVKRKALTSKSSIPEVEMGQLLVDVFGSDDVYHNVVVDSRYPFHVDYYVQSRDLFIELNGHVAHNDHWFDSKSEDDLMIVSEWNQKIREFEKNNNYKSAYRYYLKIWTERDLLKRETAKKNNLNYLVFWDGRHSGLKKGIRARLSDFREWIQAGCPDSKNWKKENTY